MFKKNSKQILKRENSKPKILIKQTPKDSLIKQDENLLINDEYMKNFINFDIKIKTEEKIKPSQKKISETTNPIKKEEDLITKNINSIHKIFSETETKMKKLKDEFEKTKISDQSEFLENPKNSLNQDEINLLKSELINLKMKLEIQNVKSKFYENIFYTCKNCIENIKNENSKFDDSSETNSNFTFQKTLLKKLDEVFTQNNKYYYETFKSSFNQEHQFSTNTFNPQNFENQQNFSKKNQILEIEKNLQILMNKINSFLQIDLNRDSEKNLNNQKFILMRQNISTTLKKIFSFYLLNDDLTCEFTQTSKFSLENSEKFVNFEVKQANEKILDDFEKFLNLHKNKILSNKLKTEVIEKVINLNNFHQSLYVTVKCDNLNLKSNSEIFVNNLNSKISNIKKLIENFLNFSEISFDKIKELMLLLKSKNLKHVDKVIFAFLMKEENNFEEILDKYENFRKTYHLIK